MVEDSDLAAYYAARAAEYENIYKKPERQEDLKRLREIVSAFSGGRRVLEVACGTGYWTAVMAGTASSITATDIGEEMLACARAKDLDAGKVGFRRADALGLDEVPGAYDAGFAGFWISHLRRAAIPRFLSGFHRRLEPGARVLILDNRFVAGSSTPISRTDEEGNTYQRRQLGDGSEYEILKNFPSPDEVRRFLNEAAARAPTVTELAYYWYARYEI